MEKKLEIAHFTDPLCFWCYAMEPEMRKVRVLLDDQLDYRIVMGVLSSSIHEIIGDGVDADLRFEFYRAMLSNYIRQAAEAVGMPITVDNLMECNPEVLRDEDDRRGHRRSVLAAHTRVHLRRRQEPGDH